MACPCGCGGDRLRHFTQLTGLQFARTVAQCLIPVADNLRDLNARFGLRPYEVAVVRTQWSGGRRGVGVEQVVHTLQLLPVPKLQDLTSLVETITPVGLDEVGQVLVSEISGAYSEDALLGRDLDGAPVDPGQQVYYEITFTRPDNHDGERRRFFPRSAPAYDPGAFGWSIRLERARQDRARNGDPR